MKDAILVIGTITIFVLGYIAVKQLDSFILGQITAKNSQRKRYIKIAAENQELLDFAASALKDGFAASSQIELQYICGSAKHLLRKLSRRTVDIVLLSEKDVVNISNKLSYICVPSPDESSDLSLDEMGEICIVWNKTIQFQERERMILILENEHFRLKHGYCDYLE